MAASSAAVHKNIFRGVITLYALAIFGMLVGSIRAGNPMVVIIVCLCASVLPMLLLALAMERRSLAGIADPARQSWAFLFGDTLFLPFMAAMLALGWRRLDQMGAHWYNAWWWVGLSALAGLVVGIAFHAMERANFESMAFNSPTKLFS